jgi:hypothetical protein
VRVLCNGSPCEMCFVHDHAVCTFVSDLCSVAPHSINISLLPYLSYITVLDKENFSVGESFISFLAYLY